NALLPAKGVEVPDDIISSTENLQKSFDEFLNRKGAKKIASGDLKLEKAINEWIKSNQPTMKEMAKGYILKALSTTADSFSNAYNKLDIIDDTLLGRLRGESPDFDVFMSEAAKLDADIRTQGTSAPVSSKLQSLKNSAIAMIGETNRMLNEKLTSSLAGRGTLGALKAFNIFQEVNALAEAMSTGSWSQFGTMLVKNHVPGVSAGEAAYVHESYIRAGYELICDILPPVAVPEGVCGMVSSVGEWAVDKYHQWTYKRVVDELYKGSVFDESTGNIETLTYKCDVPQHSEHVCKTREEILDLPNQCPDIWKLFTPEVKEHPAITIFEDMLKSNLVSDGEMDGAWPKRYSNLSEKYGVQLYRLYKLKIDQVTKKYFEGVIEELERRHAYDKGETYKRILEISKELGCAEPIAEKSGDSSADQKKFDEIILNYDELKKANQAIEAIKTKWNASFLTPFQPECTAESIKSCASQAKALLEKLNEAQTIAHTDVEKIVGKDAASSMDNLRDATKARLGMSFYPDDSSLYTFASEDYEKALDRLRKAKTGLSAELSYPATAFMEERVTVLATYDRPVDDFEIKWSLEDPPKEFKFISESPNMVVFKPAREGTIVIRLTAIEKKSGTTFAQIISAGGLRLLGRATIKILPAYQAPEKIYLATPFDKPGSGQIIEIGQDEMVPISVKYETPPRPGYEFCKFDWFVNGKKVLESATEKSTYAFSGGNESGAMEVSVVAASKQQRLATAKLVINVVTQKGRSLKVKLETIPANRDSVAEGEPIKLTANVAVKQNGGDLKYQWTVNGDPTGDATNVCTVDTSGKGGKSLKIEVLVMQAVGDEIFEGTDRKTFAVNAEGTVEVTITPSVVTPEVLPCGSNLKFEVVKPKFDADAYTYEWYHSIDGDWSTVVLSTKPSYEATLVNEGQALQFKVVVTDKKGRKGEAKTGTVVTGPRAENLLVTVKPTHARIYESQVIVLRAAVKAFPDSGQLTFNGLKQAPGVRTCDFPFSGKSRAGLNPVSIEVVDSKGRKGEAISQIFVIKGQAPSKETAGTTGKAGSGDEPPESTYVKPTEADLGKPTTVPPIAVPETTGKPGSVTTPPGTAATPPGSAATPPGTATTPPGTATTPPGTATTPPGTAATPPDSTKPQAKQWTLTVNAPKEVMATDFFEAKADLKPSPTGVVKLNWSNAVKKEGMSATLQFTTGGAREILCSALDDRSEILASTSQAITVRPAYITGTIPSSWSQVKNAEFSISRTTAQERCPVYGSVCAQWSESPSALKTKFSSALAKESPLTRTLTISDFKGQFKESSDIKVETTSSAGSNWYKVSALGSGFVEKGGSAIEVFYQITGQAEDSNLRSDDNNALADLKSRASKALSEARTMIASLRVSPVPGINIVPVQTEVARKATVKLVAEKTKAKSNETVKVDAIVENADDSDQPLQFEWTGNCEGRGSTVRFLATEGGKFTLSVSVSGKRGRIGSAAIEFEVEKLQANLKGVPNQIHYGQSANISVEMPDYRSEVGTPSTVPGQQQQWGKNYVPPVDEKGP
ncbi:MAG: hypothetical protein K2Z81_14425, partial [Cyanobacteria bacterium]|nr:hypothetical protein [Cyanobacteriota bacterium]